MIIGREKGDDPFLFHLKEKVCTGPASIGRQLGGDQVSLQRLLDNSLQEAGG